MYMYIYKHLYVYICVCIYMWRVHIMYYIFGYSARVFCGILLFLML